MSFTFRHNRVTILGGTGTLGQALVPVIQDKWPKVQITIISRGEHKQAEMKRKFPKCLYVIGDIKDQRSIGRYISGRDIVFHVAALKHVDVAQENPLESQRINLDGTVNAADSAYNNGVQRFIFSSTDKAVSPETTYGFHKASAEDFLFNCNKMQTATRFGVYRWGNVLGSQGSAIPYFAKTLLEERKAYITHPEMTRFWIPIEWAVQYMLRTFDECKTDRAMIPPNMKAASVTAIVSAIGDILGIKDYALVPIPMRGVEKLHEQIASKSRDGYDLTSEHSPNYSRDELVEMLRPIILKITQARAAA